MLVVFRLVSLHLIAATAKTFIWKSQQCTLCSQRRSSILSIIKNSTQQLLWLTFTHHVKNIDKLPRANSLHIRETMKHKIHYNKPFNYDSKHRKDLYNREKQWLTNTDLSGEPSFHNEEVLYLVLYIIRCNTHTNVKPVKIAQTQSSPRKYTTSMSGYSNLNVAYPGHLM